MNIYSRTYEALQIAERAHWYAKLRAEDAARPAAKVWRYIREADGISYEEFHCRHDWVISEETDRCYCCKCGADGDA